MQAAYLIGPRTIELRPTQAPDCPPDGLLLEMKACGICGSDLRRWQEGPPSGVSHLIQGHELAGVVTAIGRETREYKPGDRLALAPDIHCGLCYYCRRGLYNLCLDLKLLGITPGLDGGFSEQVMIPRSVLTHGIVHWMPEGLSFAEGALAETLSSVLASHAKCKTTLGETVVVMGAGPVGCLHTVVAQARGARVILAEPLPARRRGAEKFSPDAILDVTRQDPVEAVRKLTNGIGADVVICANPVTATQTQAVEIVRRGGKVVLFGGLPKADPTTHLDGNRIHYGEIEVVGSFSYHPSFHEEALRVLSRKQVRAELFITHTKSLSRISEGFEIAKSGEALKVMIEPD
ncbi:MAG TPA: alcohol dehydrogenase catalytic domain-containing protein [Candidatus Paceibacterota bacterium]|nr:alcohol dehydrogenase catalytic domain-containing protein [Candidatus Paceibacterota bacterium]